MAVMCPDPAMSHSNLKHAMPLLSARPTQCQEPLTCVIKCLQLSLRCDCEKRKIAVRQSEGEMVTTEVTKTSVQ